MPDRRGPPTDLSRDSGMGNRTPDVAGAVAMDDEPAAISAWHFHRQRRRVTMALTAVVLLTIGAGSAVYVHRRHAQRAGTIGSVAPLASEPGSKRSASFSPDGREIVYSWSPATPGDARLVVRPVAGGGQRNLTLGAADDEYPSWSPRGQYIAFERITPTDCAVYVIAPDGRDERRIGDCRFGAAGPLTWTRDGRGVIFSHRTTALDARRLVLLDLSTGKLSGVTEPVVGTPGDAAPALALNGRRLVFERSRAIGVADLFSLDTGAGAVQGVTHDEQPLAGAAFEHDNSSVVFASQRGGRFALWRSLLDGGPPLVLLAAANELREPSISSDGRLLAFDVWRQTTSFARVSSVPGAVPEYVDTGAAAFVRQPQLSPDGRQLAFVSDRNGRDQLWLAPAAGGEPRVLPSADADYLETPRWSPDGRVVVFAGGRNQQLDVWAVTLADGHLERVTADGKSRAASFSHDGNWLYFASARSGTWQIWRRDWPAGGHVQALTTSGGLAALESPDGDTLYYVRPDRPGLWLRDPRPGGDPMIVIDTVSPSDWCSWAMTEGTIWFIDRPDIGPPALARYSLATHLVTREMTMPDLLPASGMTVVSGGASVIVTRVVSTQVDLKLATLE